MVRKRKHTRGRNDECGYRISIKNDAAARKEFLDKCWVTWYEVGFGVRQYTCFHPTYQCPLAVVWINIADENHHTGDVLYSFTVPYFRRLGIRDLINKAIFKELSLIRTSSGSDTGGMAYINMRGYKWCDIQKCWYLQKPKEAE